MTDSTNQIPTKVGSSFSLTQTSVALIVAGVGLSISAVNCLYFWKSLNSLPVNPNDFHYMLLGYRQVVTVLFAVICIGIWRDRLGGRVATFTSVLLIIWLHVNWYFEKFIWLNVIGEKEGSEGYVQHLVEIGWFRGANQMDNFISLVTVVLGFWLISRFFVRRR